ncbi:MAG: O-antigen ligase family protein [Staphylococcus equorum]|uniref:O-antigen ligase family protein n=1 Tax=Tetragenococcus halophilus TaxID=51669 RepID=UPI001F1C8D74|nr:O-antigen ligase family protein [Tetragenococcus halophilus]MCF1675847.1 O-antigen ligase family protein [Tetragenococcus halophilus]MDN6736177.1 O-antigen ligase family protein [Tetragenococcus koreensis]MDN6750919.1 O-antigen ligase family protein [Staphylococcus equorum]
MEILKIKRGNWIYILGFMLVLSYIVPSQNLKLLIVAMVFYSAWLFDLCNTTLLLLVSTILLNFEGNSLLSLVAILPAFFNKKLFTKKFSVTRLLFYISLCFFGMLSYIFGENPNIFTLLLFFLCWIIYESASVEELDMNEVQKYAMMGIIFVCIALLFSLDSNETVLMYGRLSINDNVRELANAVSISVTLLFCTYFVNEKNKEHNVVKTFLLGVGLLILLLTLSKGAIFALIGTLIILILFSKIPISKKLVIFSLFIILGIIMIYYFSSNNLFRTQRLFEEDTSGLSGRTAIWSTYWEAMKSSPLTFFFGFGPGDIKRLHLISYYSHSLILDVLFSYGIVGFILFSTMIVQEFIKSIKSRNNLSIAILAFALLLFSTHSTATNTSFYILMGISSVMSSMTILERGEQDEKGSTLCR